MSLGKTIDHHPTRQRGIHAQFLANALWSRAFAPSRNPKRKRGKDLRQSSGVAKAPRWRFGL